jgi:hypothetical protein
MGMQPDETRVPETSPPPVVDAAQYRLLRRAVDVIDRIAAEQGVDPGELVSHRTQAVSLERIRTALWLFEAFPPADGDGTP